MQSWCRLWTWTHFTSLFALSQSWQVSLCLLDPWVKSRRLFIIKAVVRNQWIWLAYSGPRSEEWGIAVWRSGMVDVEVDVGDLSMLDKLCLRSTSSWILVMVPLSSESGQACPHAVHLATLDCWLFPDLLCFHTMCPGSWGEQCVSDSARPHQPDHESMTHGDPGIPHSHTCFFFLLPPFTLYWYFLLFWYSGWSEMSNKMFTVQEYFQKS